MCAPTAHGAAGMHAGRASLSPTAASVPDGATPLATLGRLPPHALARPMTCVSAYMPCRQITPTSLLASVLLCCLLFRPPPNSHAELPPPPPATPAYLDAPTMPPCPPCPPCPTATPSVPGITHVYAVERPELDPLNFGTVLQYQEIRGGKVGGAGGGWVGAGRQGVGR